jgi:adenylyl-sulfate kinase
LVIWITGLSGAGKTTLCEAMRAALKPRVPELVVLDGDDVRQAFGGDLGYDEESRARQFRRLQSIARVLAQQGLVVLVAAVYQRPDLMAWNRANLPGYFEVYLKTSLATVRARDPKGLYRRALAGETRDVVGMDIPYHAPERPDLTIDADHPEAPDRLAARVIAAAPQLVSRMGGRSVHPAAAAERE